MERLSSEHTEGDPPSDDVKLEILTMHAAKGLEWDLVVLPALNKSPNAPATTLLHWLPFTTASGQEQVLMAPQRAAEQAENTSLIALIRQAQKDRASFEEQRLLYVAATRARQHLVLSASLDPDKAEVAPAAGSLLAHLWKTTAAEFRAALHAFDTEAVVADSATQAHDQSLRRVADGWRPDIGPRLAWRPSLPPKEPDGAVEFNWAGIQARRTGTVLHRLLERVGRIGIENFSEPQRQLLIDRIPLLLRTLGTGADALEDATRFVARALNQTLDSDNGRWILSNRHVGPACELAVAGVIDGQFVNAIVDRTFIDETGIRWIIDYKSGYHAGADLEGFVAQESERYESQLAMYRRLFEQLEDRPVKTALYLPRHDALAVSGEVS